MRLTTLLLLIVAIILLTAPAASFAQSVASPKSNSPIAGDNGAILRGDASSPAFSEYVRSEYESSEYARDLRRFDAGDSHVTCLTMRTYVVARQSRNSDVTRPVRYFECVPAWKFDMRTTELKQEDVSKKPEKQ